MTFMNLFISVPQSKYAAMAIIAAVVTVSLTMLFGKEPIPLSQKFAFILLVFLISLPGLLLALFQLTCIVTGAGRNNDRWWCSAYAWIISIVLIVYCTFLVAIAVITLATGEKALIDVSKQDTEHFGDMMTSANAMARNMLASMDVDSKKEQKVGGDTFAVQGEASVPAPVSEPPTGVPKEAVQTATVASVPAGPAVVPQSAQPVKDALKVPASEEPQPFVGTNSFGGSFGAYF